MTGHRVNVRTHDGAIDCYTFHPEAAGVWPAVIMYMDAFGIRPQLGEMAQRLAAAGFFVVLPNLYYRTPDVAPFDREAVLVEGPERDRFKGMIQSINSAMVMQDSAAILQMLETREQARTAKIGVVGYCMGGGYALTAAGTFPERIAAAASFHGGSLATDRIDSPHTVATMIRGKVYIGMAEIDPSFPKDQQDRLDTALRDAGVDYVMETYDGARHGFAVTGHLVYDRHASERHWTTLIELFRETLH
jgi:carboxymethylenebutenolidase